MARISEAIETFVTAQHLGFLATVCADGTPNLSPKGLTFVLDETHLIIGEVRSPRSIENIRTNPVAEVNVVDVVARKGYRFKGYCTVYDAGSEYQKLLAFLREKGAESDINSIIVLEVESLSSIFSPVYDSPVSETEIRKKWKERIDQQNDDLMGDA